MRPKAVTALLLALASIQLSTGLLLAKPTRPPVHPAARRMIIAEPARRSTRERIAHPFIPARPRVSSGQTSRISSIRLASRSTQSKRRSAPTLALSPVPANRHARTRIPPNTPAQERAFVAQAAIDSASRGHRSETRSARPRRGNSAVENVARNSFRGLHETDTSRRSFNSSSTGDEPSASFSDPASTTQTRIDDDGVLHPALGSLPLKSIEEEASTPVLLPALRVSSLYDSRGLLVVPPPLYGSRQILLHQNQMADRDGLIRVQNDADLLDLRREKKLVALPNNETLRVDFRLPENRRYSRPWTAAFLTIMARDYYDSFHTSLQVDSAVRTVAVQQRLIRTNGNAAPSTGDTASPHLTGQAIDIAKGGLSRTQIAWMRTYLQPLIDLGKIDVEEEFRQSCFHISVYKNFVPIAPAHFSVAAAGQLHPTNLSAGPTE